MIKFKPHGGFFYANDKNRKVHGGIGMDMREVMEMSMEAIGGGYGEFILS